MSFTIARSVDDALTALASGARPIAGGSDLVVAARHGAMPLPDRLVAVDRIRELGAIAQNEAGDCVIGAAITHARLIEDPIVTGVYPALADAAALIGSPATRNVGTIGGNIMNASPAMDTGAPLVVLGAMVELRSRAVTRTVPVADLWSGPGRTVAGPEELCTFITLPRPAARSASAYVRLEYRRAMEIAVVGAAAAVELDGDGALVAVSVALTAVAPTILVVEGLAASLGGRLPDPHALAVVAAAARDQARPIGDLRASDGYRRHTVGVMAARAVEAATRRARGQIIAVPVNRAAGVGGPA